MQLFWFKGFTKFSDSERWSKRSCSFMRGCVLDYFLVYF